MCGVITFGCSEGQELFTNECGCGCIDGEPEPEPDARPDPNDPTVHYILDSDQDPSVCYPILFGCDIDQGLFSNECGCGCIDLDPSSACPDPGDPTVTYISDDPMICMAIDYACDDGQEMFSSDCGCGCVAQ